MRDLQVPKNFTSNNKVFVVLLNYNGSNDTKECIESLLQLDYSNYQIVIVDNSDTQIPIQSLLEWAKSTSVSFSFVTEVELDLTINTSKIVFVKAKQNKGFAAGNNIVLKAILNTNETNSFIWILNNDTAVEENSLNRQLNYFHNNAHRKIGILGSKLIYYYNRSILQGIGGKFNTNFFISEHVGEGESISKAKSFFGPIDYIIGASIMVPFTFLSEVGVLSEDFFLYYEELDWTYRANRKGWEIDWCEDSLVYHKEGSSIGSSYDSKKKSFFSEINVFKSRKIVVRKYYRIGLKFYVTSLLLVLNRLRKGKVKLSYELLKITFGR